MKKVFCLTVFIGAIGAPMMMTAFGESKGKSKLAIEDLAADAKAKVAAIGEMTSAEDAFAAAREDKALAQAAGTLAALSQAITEHPAGKSTGIAGPALRDAALGLSRVKKLDEAKKLAASAQAALGGKGEGEAKADWAKLVNMHRSMEELQDRFNQIRRLRRKPKDPKTDSIHATTLAVLAKTIQADTHEVKDKADLPEWTKQADALAASTIALAQAMKAQDKGAITAQYLIATKSCAGCHDKFRD